MIQKTQAKWAENCYFEDMYFYYKYFIYEPEIYIENQMLYYYRHRTGSITTNKAEKYKRITDMFLVLKSICQFIIQNNLSNEYISSVEKHAKRYYLQYTNTDLFDFVSLYYQKFCFEIENLRK